MRSGNKKYVRRAVSHHIFRIDFPAGPELIGELIVYVFAKHGIGPRDRTASPRPRTGSSRWARADPELMRLQGCPGEGRVEAGAMTWPRGSGSPRSAFDLRHVRGILSGSIGGGGGPYGRLAGLLGRVLMLRASRREDRKRVPQYSSSQLPDGSAGTDVRESFGKCQCSADQAPGGPFVPGLRFRKGRAFPAGMFEQGASVSATVRHTRPRGSEGR